VHQVDRSAFLANHQRTAAATSSVSAASIVVFSDDVIGTDDEEDGRADGDDEEGGGGHGIVVEGVGQRLVVAVKTPLEERAAQKVETPQPHHQPQHHRPIDRSAHATSGHGGGGGGGARHWTSLHCLAQFWTSRPSCLGC